MPRCESERRPAGPTWGGCALPGTAKTKFSNLLAVRQHHMNVLGVRMMDQFQFLQPAHPVALLSAQQVPLPGMHSQDFSGRRNLKTLGGAAMRLQFELLHLFFCHQHYLVRIFPQRQACPPAGAAGALAVPPFLGASRAIMMLASMR